MCCALRPEVQHQKIKKFIVLDKHGSRFKGKGNDILLYVTLIIQKYGESHIKFCTITIIT